MNDILVTINNKTEKRLRLSTIIYYIRVTEEGKTVGASFIPFSTLKGISYVRIHTFAWMELKLVILGVASSAAYTTDEVNFCHVR